jgi:hypothetical protein
MDLTAIITGAFASVLASLAFVAATLALDMIRDEAKASTPRLAEWLRQRAVNRLPLPLQERLGEEWAAVLADMPGPISKLWCAVGFLISAFRVEPAPESEPEPVTTRASGTIPPNVFLQHSSDDEYAKWVALLQAVAGKKSIEIEVEIKGLRQWLIQLYPDRYFNDDETMRRIVKLLKAHRNSIAHAGSFGGKRSDKPEDDRP